MIEDPNNDKAYYFLTHEVKKNAFSEVRYHNNPPTENVDSQKEMQYLQLISPANKSAKGVMGFRASSNEEEDSFHDVEAFKPKLRSDLNNGNSSSGEHLQNTQLLPRSKHSALTFGANTQLLRKTDGTVSAQFAGGGIQSVEKSASISNMGMTHNPSAIITYTLGGNSSKHCKDADDGHGSPRISIGKQLHGVQSTENPTRNVNKNFLFGKSRFASGGSQSPSPRHHLSFN